MPREGSEQNGRASQGGEAEGAVARRESGGLRKALPTRVPNYLELKKEDHTIRYVLLFMLGFVFLLFLVDLRHEIGREQHEMEIANEHCYQ